MSLQTFAMFAGEASCLFVFEILYYYHKWMKMDENKFGKQKFSPLIFAIPAFCDVFGTSTMFVGLDLTNASSFQLLRGSLIIFTALLSVAFFGSKLQLYHWVGMFTVVIGLVVVGVGDEIGEDNSDDAHSILAGDLLIVVAQIIVAIQMIVEQLFVQGLNVPPLQAVGWEGVFGCCFVGIGLVLTYFIPWHFPSGPDFWQYHIRFEDAIDAVHQIFYIPTLTAAFFLSIVSVAFLNYAGLSVTKEINAITRTTLDNVRTVFIWVFGLAFMWQKFNIFQPIGFFILVIGICIYYNLIFSWLMKKLHIWPSVCGAPDGEEQE